MDAVNNALWDPYRRVWPAAVEALAQFGDTQSAYALFRALKHEAGFVILLAAKVLEDMGDQRVDDALEDIEISDMEWRDLTNYEMVAVVQKMDLPRSVPALIGAMKNWSPQVASAAAEALGSIDDPLAVDALSALNHWSNDVRQVAEEALQKRAKATPRSSRVSWAK